MDIYIKEMRSKPLRLWKDIMVILFNNVTFHLKNRLDRMRLVYCTEYRKSFFLGGMGGGDAHWKGGAYYKFWALGGALIRSGALIGSRALIRAFTVGQF